MRLSNRQLLMFGPLTIVIEWLGLLMSFYYTRGLDLNVPISLLSVAEPPLPTIFATTLTLAGLSFFIFSFALRHYSKNIVWVSLLAGIMLALTGFARYSGRGGLSDILHNIFIYSSLASFGVVIWMMKKHPHKVISSVSEKVFIFLLISSAITVVSLNIHRYVAFIQLTMLVVLQVWVMVIVWHSRYYELYKDADNKQLP